MRAEADVRVEDRPERWRLLVMACAALWLPFLAWGPEVFDNTDRLRRSLATIPGYEIVYALCIGVALACIGFAVLARTSRVLRWALGLVALWWLFLALVLLQANLVVAFGLALVGFLSGVVTYATAADADE